MKFIDYSIVDIVKLSAFTALFCVAGIVFCVHPHELPPAQAFLRKCKTLKPILIDITTQSSIQQLKNRRAIFSRGAPDWAKPGYTLPESELRFLQNFNNVIKLKLGVWPCARIELADFWKPETGAPLLEKIFQEQNINNPGWQELYQ